MMRSGAAAVRQSRDAVEAQNPIVRTISNVKTIWSDASVDRHAKRVSVVERVPIDEPARIAEHDACAWSLHRLRLKRGRREPHKQGYSQRF